MELRQLEAFVSVAEERNFTRAAGRLYVAQSGLSATIQSLERELGAPLFVRTTRRVELTAAGLALLPEARRTLASASAAIEAVGSIEGLRSGTVHVGFVQTTNIAASLARFRSTYPGVQLRLRQAGSADLDAMLLDGALDVIFTTETEPAPPDVLSIPVLRSPLVVAGRTEPGKGSTMALSVAAQHQMIGYPSGWGIRMLTDRAMRAAGLDPRVDVEVNDTMTLLDLVEAGLGIAIVPGTVSRLRPALPTSEIADGSWEWVVAGRTIAPMPRNPAARALWQMLCGDEGSPSRASISLPFGA